MYRALQVASVLLVAAAMALSLAHALELPGKMRLSKETYLVVQQIYYPGFTIGGAAEPLGVLALLALVATTPHANTRFWWMLAALLSLLTAHLIYWFVTHPVNNVWTKDMQMTGIGATFFSLFATEITGDWAKLRDVWEYSHVARAVFATLSLVFLTLAISA